MGARWWAEQREFFRPEHTAEKFLEIYRTILKRPALASIRNQ